MAPIRESAATPAALTRVWWTSWTSEFITKDADGKSKKVDVWEFAVPDEVDLSAWAGGVVGPAR
jgi:hypothetical protein